jgi:hypothetical protein
VRQALAELAEAEIGERGVDALADLGRLDLAQPEGVGDVVEHRAVWPERVRLEDQTEVALLGRHLDGAGGVVDGAVLDADRAAVRRLEAGRGPQQRRLAAARGAEQRNHLALRQLHRDALEDGVVAIGKVEVLDAQLDAGRAGRWRGFSHED